MGYFNVNGKRYNNFLDYWNLFGKSLNSEDLLRDVEYTNTSGKRMAPINTTQGVPYILTKDISNATNWTQLTTEPVYFQNNPGVKYHAYSNKLHNLAFKAVEDPAPTGGNPAANIAEETDKIIRKTGIPSGIVDETSQKTNPVLTQTTGGNLTGNTPTGNIPAQRVPNGKYTTWLYFPSNSGAPTPPTNTNEQKAYWNPDWDHLYDIAGAGLNIGNAIRNYRLAQKAERPILHDPVEHHRAVYGDYAAKVLAQQNAGNLLNAASRPITSDIAQTLATLLQSLIAANDAINQGNLADNNKREQTAEIAWLLEKENKNIRHDVAMQNRDAIAKSRMNLYMNRQQLNAGITNTLDTLRKVWQTDWQKFRNRRDSYQDIYDLEFATQNGLTAYLNNHPELDSLTKLMALNYLYNPSQFNTWYLDPNTTEEQKSLVLDIIRASILLGKLEYYKKKGVHIPDQKPLPPMFFDPSGMSTYPSYKEGGSVTSLNKEVLKMRSKNEDRFAKIIQKDNDRFKKTIFKSIDRMYRASKYLFGGGVVLTEFTPVRTPDERAPLPMWLQNLGSSEKKQTSSKIDELLKQGSALDIDRAILQRMAKLLTSMNDIAGLGSSAVTGALEASMLLFLGKVKLAEDHKKAYDAALKALLDNNALGEAYIDTNGYIMIQEENGNYKKTSSVKEALKNKIVTYREALDNRNTNPTAAFNYSIINDMASGIGMKNIMTRIKEVTENLGIEDPIFHALGKIKNGKIVSGTGSILETLQKLMKEKKINLEDGLYELKKLSKSNADELNAAIDSIYESLTTLEQLLINLKAAKNNKSIEGYLLTLLAPKLKQGGDLEFDIKSISDPNDSSAKKKSGTSGDDKEIDLPPMMRDILGQSGVKTKMSLLYGGETIDSSSGNVGAVADVTLGVLTKENKRIVSSDRLTGTEFLNGTDISSYGDVSKATFLGEKIDDWNKIVLLDLYFYKTVCPINSDGTPNFKAAEQLFQLIKTLNENKVTNKKSEKISAEDFNDITNNFTEEQVQLIKLVSDKLQIDLNSILNNDTFLFSYAIADETAFNGYNGWFSNSLKIPSLAKEIKNNDDNRNIYKGFLNTINHNKTEKQALYSEKDDANHLYKGAIYMPYRKDVFGSINTAYSRSVTLKESDILQHLQKSFSPSENTIKLNK